MASVYDPGAHKKGYVYTDGWRGSGRFKSEYHKAVVVGVEKAFGGKYFFNVVEVPSFM